MTLKHYSTLIAVFTITLSVTDVHAQSTQNCLIDSLDISTGKNKDSLVQYNTYDPHWMIQYRSGHIGTTPTSPTYAIATTGNISAAYKDTKGRWITDSASHINPGIPKPQTLIDTLILRRNFRTCGNGTLVFNLNILCDDRIGDILIDGISVPNFTTVINGLNQSKLSNYKTAGGIKVTFQQILLKGTHTLDIMLVSDVIGIYDHNAIGLSMGGQIIGNGAILVNDYNPDCKDYECPTSTKISKPAQYVHNYLSTSNPNPFNHSTQISYNINSINSSAFIIIYNMTGQVVKRLPINNIGKGTISVDGSNLNSGTYLYSLIVDGEVIDTKNMMLSK